MGLMDRLLRGRSGNATREAAPLEPGAEAVLGELVAFIASQPDADLDAADVDPQADVFDYGYVDSLGLADFLEWIERRFGVRITDDDFIHLELTRLAALAQHVAGRTERAPASER